MTGFRTIVPAVQAALTAAISAAAPSDTVVSLGYPPGGLAAKAIWVSADFDMDVAWATTGWKAREEDATVEVRIAVSKAAGTVLDPQADALALAGVVEDALAADRTLGGVVDRAEVTHSKGQEAIPEEHKHEFGITLTVSWAGETVA